MKIKLFTLITLICAASIFSSCVKLPASEIQSDTSAVTYLESEMLKNSPENQAYVEKYMYPFAVTGFFRYSFSPGNMEELLVTEHPPLKTIFNAFYNYDYPDSDLHLTDLDTEVPQEIFEGTLMNHLDLTPEQIRTSCAQYYDADAEIYTAAFGLGGGPIEIIITDSGLDGNKLNLSYDMYGANPSDDGFGWKLVAKGALEMEIDGDNYRYISNQFSEIE